jgi:hypothetical protein
MGLNNEGREDLMKSLEHTSIYIDVEKSVGDWQSNPSAAGSFPSCNFFKNYFLNNVDASIQAAISTYIQLGLPPALPCPSY